MILDRLTLYNFCIYQGEQVFELAPARRNGKAAPIVLFGGINGGGKTTLLDAVQLVLYGKRARCSKQAEMPYEKFLRDSIHHDVDPTEGASVSLSFRYAAQGQEYLYEVRRSWSEVGSRIRERVQVSRDGEPDGWLSENWNQVVEELIPLGIAQLCFFDAEKIRFLAEDETSTLALGGAIKSLLGLDLAERLLADATTMEGRVAKRTEGSSDLREAEHLEGLVETKEAEIRKFKQEQASLENPRLAAKNRLKEAEERFARVGGQHWEQHELRQRRVIELEQQARETEERLVALAAGDLPLALVPHLLTDVAVQADRERQATETAIVSSLLSERDEQLVKRLRQKRLGKEWIEVVRELLEQDRSDRMAHSDIERRLDLSEPAKRRLDHLREHGLCKQLETAGGLVERLEGVRRDLENTHRGLAATPESSTVQEVAEEFKAASTELAKLEQQVSRIDKLLTHVQYERDELKKKLHKLRRKVVDEQIRTEEDARIAGRLIRTQQVMRTFLGRATARKIDRLSELITESFRYLLRKKTLVQRVLIDPHTFFITLFDDRGRVVEKQRLSEGEKQIFAISVLWGLSRASARPLPAIIDTPMARLDAKHRDQLVRRYFPHASHQVIVLSTDTEVERQYFHDLQPHVARAYHLNYDEKRKVTIAEEGYFWDTDSAAIPEEVAV